MSKHSDEIRNKYIKNPPEGMTADDIRHMGEDDLLYRKVLLWRTLDIKVARTEAGIANKR